MPQMGFNPWDPGYLQAQAQSQGNLLDRQTAWERNFIEHDLGLKGLQLQAQQAQQSAGTQQALSSAGRAGSGGGVTRSNDQARAQSERYGADVGYLSNLLGANANAFAADRQAGSNEYGALLDHNSNLMSSLANLAGTRHASDRSFQGQMGSAALGAQSSMFAPALQQQRFATIAPLVGQILGGLA